MELLIQWFRSGNGNSNRKRFNDENNSCGRVIAQKVFSDCVRSGIYQGKEMVVL
jgi:hypothetical protein